MKNTSKLKNVFEEITSKYGDVFVSGDAILQTKPEIIPITLSIDLATSGGFAVGTAMSLSGVSGSGKSTLALVIAANAQKRGQKIIYLDAERRLSPSLLATIEGLDTSEDKFRVIHPSREIFLTAEQNLHILRQLITQEPNLMIIIDSVATLCPESDYAAEPGEHTKRANIAGIMYSFTRQIAQVLPSMGSNIIYISHVQANPSGYGGPSEMGGNAIKYASSYKLQCLSTSEVPKDSDKKIGRESVFKVQKSGLGPGTGAGKFYIRYKKGYDRTTDIFTLASEMGFIHRKGAWYNFTNGKEEIKLQGEKSVLDYLEENPKFADYLESEIRKMALEI